MTLVRREPRHGLSLTQFGLWGNPLFVCQALAKSRISTDCRCENMILYVVCNLQEIFLHFSPLWLFLLASLLSLGSLKQVPLMVLE